jgi:hypothetical protein
LLRFVVSAQNPDDPLHPVAMTASRDNFDPVMHDLDLFVVSRERPVGGLDLWDVVAAAAGNRHGGAAFDIKQYATS